MFKICSRRDLFRLAGAAAATMIGGRAAFSQGTTASSGPAAKSSVKGIVAGTPEVFPTLQTRSAVSIIQGNDRRKMIFDSLMAIDEQIQPRLKRKKSVVIKPNIVSPDIQLASTHPDALRGILDYLDSRFKGPIYIAESSAENTMHGYENFGFNRVASEHKKVVLVDLNEEARYVVVPLIDSDLHVVPVRLAARLLDPDAFIFSAAMPKTHNMVIATLSMKNMVLGAPLHQAPKETRQWNDKRKYHVGIRQGLYNFYLTAQAMQPYWGAAVIDGYEGMEGNGPTDGTPVPHKIALASTDFVAADRIASATMGIDYSTLGWLKYCGEVGIGQWDISKIDIRGPQIGTVERKYRLHPDIDRMLKWMGPMEELSPNLGWVTPLGEGACHT